MHRLSCLLLTLSDFDSLRAEQCLIARRCPTMPSTIPFSRKGLGKKSGKYRRLGLVARMAAMTVGKLVFLFKTLNIIEDSETTKASKTTKALETNASNAKSFEIIATKTGDIKDARGFTASTHRGEQFAFTEVAMPENCGELELQRLRDYASQICNSTILYLCDLEHCSQSSSMANCVNHWCSKHFEANARASMPWMSDIPSVLSDYELARYLISQQFEYILTLNKEGLLACLMVLDQMINDSKQAVSTSEACTVYMWGPYRTNCSPPWSQPADMVCTTGIVAVSDSVLSESVCKTDQVDSEVMRADTDTEFVRADFDDEFVRADSDAEFVRVDAMNIHSDIEAIQDKAASKVASKPLLDSDIGTAEALMREFGCVKCYLNGTIIVNNYPPTKPPIFLDPLEEMDFMSKYGLQLKAFRKLQDVGFVYKYKVVVYYSDDDFFAGNPRKGKQRWFH